MWITLAVFVFYLIRSLLYPNNVTPAILSDFIQQLKPYAAFFTVYDIGISINSKYRKKFCTLVKRLAFIITPIGISFVFEFSWLYDVFGHPSRYASISICLGTTYLLFSNQTKHDIIVTLLIYSVGLLSLRSKMFGFVAAAYGIMLFWNNIKQHKSLFTLRHLTIASAFIAVVIWTAWEKISFYFIFGTQVTNTFARPLLYMGAWDILKDYPLLGSGFGSYAEDASGQWYSPLYFKYKLYLSDDFWGSSFVSDTWFPVLAQFGCIGIALFILFWMYIYRKGKERYNNGGELLYFKMTILIMVMFFIESVADATLTQNRGVYLMMMLALCVSKDAVRRI